MLQISSVQTRPGLACKMSVLPWRLYCKFCNVLKRSGRRTLDQGVWTHWGLLGAYHTQQQQQQQRWRRFLSTKCPDTARGGLPRFFVEELPSSQGSIVPIDGDEFWHMSKVLRLGLNDRVELFDGKGKIVEGLVMSMGRSSLDVAAAEDVRSLSPIGPHWHVAAAFGSLKGGRGDWLVEKCTELGARSLVPLLTERTSTVSEGRSDRWNRLVLAATKQCQRLHFMNVRNSTRLDFLLSESASFDVIFLAEANATPLAKALPVIESDWNGLLLVGPEGDFTDSEKKALVKAGAVPVGLGPRRLRVETAAIAMLSAVMIMCEHRV